MSSKNYFVKNRKHICKFTEKECLSKQISYNKPCQLCISNPIINNNFVAKVKDVLKPTNINDLYSWEQITKAIVKVIE